MANLKNVIYLSNEDYETLVSSGTVTINGETLTYDENNVYVTPDKLASTTEDGLMSASDKAKLDGIADGSNLVTTNTDQTISGIKTFSNKIGFSNSSTNIGYRISENANADLILERTNDGTTWNTIDSIDVGGNAYLRTIMPQNSASYNLGSSSRKWKDLFLSGIIRDGNNGTYGLSLPDTTSFTANSELVDTASAQTITGKKTIPFVNGSGSTGFTIGFTNSAYYTFMGSCFKGVNGNKDLGESATKWKNLFLSGYIGNSNSGFGLILPDTTSFTANKTIATTDQLGTAASKDFTTSVTSGSADLVTSGAVYTAISNLRAPMIFKGTLGTGGTITSLPTASSSNEGFTYKVITAGTYASQTAKVGDLFTSNGSAWVYIPSGDEVMSDTWRGINVNGTALVGSSITTGNINFKNGTYVTATGNGNDVTFDVVAAGANTAGVVTTGAQTFGGVKTFDTEVKVHTPDSLSSSGDEYTTEYFGDFIRINRTFEGDTASCIISFPWDFEDGDEFSLITDRELDEFPAVKYTSQTLSEARKQQARTNIGAAAKADVSQWWYYESSFTRTLNAGSSVLGSSLTKINSTSGGSEYAVTTSGSTISAVNIKVGDLIFTKYGEIGCVTSIPSVGDAGSGYVSYRVKWISGASWYCIEEGTKITMADRTERPIEEVKQGDLILGWDFENNCSIEAVALFANFTHRDDKTNFVVFSNGEYISGTDDHFIYSVDKGRDAPISELQEGEKCLDTNGEIIEIYAIHRGIFQMGQKNFYHLVSSNNTYFANGVMNAAHPINKFNWISYGANQQIPEEVMEILEQDAEEFKTFEFLVKNDTFRHQSVNLMKEIKTRENEIAELKQYLLDTDYVAIKHSEGLVIDDNILEERQAARDRINLLQDQIENDYGPAYNNLVIEYSPLGADTLLSNEARRAKYFKIANKRDNEALDIFKQYYVPVEENE